MKTLCLSVWLAALVAMTGGCSGTVAPEVDGAMERDDAGIVSDAPTVSDAAVSDAAGSDAPFLPSDSAVVDAGTSSSAVCADGFVDPPEVCDPGAVPDGGVFSPARRECPTCDAHLCGGGVLDPSTNVCVCHTMIAICDLADETRLLSWESAAERDRYVAAIRSMMAAAGVTSVSGTVALRRYGGVTGTWYWVDDLATGSGRRVATDLPPWRERVPLAGIDYARLYIDETTVELYQATGSSGFFLNDPPGVRR